jgi:3-methyladenine DNA glycosylase AlkD
MSEITDTIHSEIVALSTPEKIAKVLRFFKTSKESYGGHDKFLGVSVPELRILARKYKDLSISDLSILIASEFNEIRLISLMILRIQYEKADFAGQQKIVNFYIKHVDFVNNWNLVDLSAPYILGNFCIKTTPDILWEFAKSSNIWHKRIAIIASHALVRNGCYDLTLQFAELFLDESHDLIQKATGWMLREIGKRDRSTLLSFLDKFAAKMPSVMLSYAFEHLDPTQRKCYRAKRSQIS